MPTAIIMIWPQPLFPPDMAKLLSSPRASLVARGQVTDVPISVLVPCVAAVGGVLIGAVSVLPRHVAVAVSCLNGAVFILVVGVSVAALVLLVAVAERAGIIVSRTAVSRLLRRAPRARRRP